MTLGQFLLIIKYQNRLIMLTITILNRYSPYRSHNIVLTYCYIIS